MGRNVGDDASTFGNQKAETRVGFRRMKHQANRRTTVHPCASQLNFMSDSGLARPYKSPGHVSLDPLIGPGRRPFRRPVPPKNRPPLLVFDTRSSLAPTLKSALVESNDTGVCRLGTNHGFLHCVTAPPQLHAWPRRRPLTMVCRGRKTPANQLAPPFPG